MRRTLVVVIDVEGEGLRFDATAENIGRKLAAADPEVTEYGLRYRKSYWDGAVEDDPVSENKAPPRDESRA